MRIVVDQDEVLADFVDKVLQRWNDLNDTHFKKSDVNCWRMQDTLGHDRHGKSAEEIVTGWMTEKNFFATLVPILGARAGFTALQQMGHDLIVATSLPEVESHAFDEKRAWMRRYFPYWPLKNFITCSRKGLIDADMLIDDGSHNLEDWTAHHRSGGVIFDAPWNQDVPRIMNGELVYRAYGWQDVLSLVRNHMNDSHPDERRKDRA